MGMGSSHNSYSSIKMNKNTLGKRWNKPSSKGVCKRIIPKFKKSTKEDILRIREKIKKEKRLMLLKMLIAFGVFGMVVLGIYFFA